MCLFFCCASAGWGSIAGRQGELDNTLYEGCEQENSHRFQLADFSLWDNISWVQVPVATSMYVAPEVMARERQTPKAGVWLLGVTMLWVQNIADLRDQKLHIEGPHQLFGEVVARVNTD